MLSGLSEQDRCGQPLLMDYLNTGMVAGISGRPGFVDMCVHFDQVHAATREEIFKLENNRL